VAHCTLNHDRRTVDVIMWSAARIEYADGMACAMFPAGSRERVCNIPLDKPLPTDIVNDYPPLETDLELCRLASESPEKFHARRRWEIDRRSP